MEQNFNAAVTSNKCRRVNGKITSKRNKEIGSKTENCIELVHVRFQTMMYCDGPKQHEIH